MQMASGNTANIHVQRIKKMLLDSCVGKTFGNTGCSINNTSPVK